MANRPAGLPGDKGSPRRPKARPPGDNRRGRPPGGWKVGEAELPGTVQLGRKLITKILGAGSSTIIGAVILGVRPTQMGDGTMTPEIYERYKRSRIAPVAPGIEISNMKPNGNWVEFEFPNEIDDFEPWQAPPGEILPDPIEVNDDPFLPPPKRTLIPMSPREIEYWAERFPDWFGRPRVVPPHGRPAFPIGDPMLKPIGDPIKFDAPPGPQDKPTGETRLNVEFREDGVMRIRKSTHRAQWYRRGRDSKYSRYYMSAMKMIDNTWGVIDEAMQLADAIMWNTYAKDQVYTAGPRKGEPVHAMVLEGRSTRAVVEGILSGKYEVDVGAAVVDYAIDQAQDMLIGKMARRGQQGLSRYGWSRFSGFQTGPAI